MSPELDDLTINVSRLDPKRIIATWDWLVGDIQKILLISKIGDLFFEGKDNQAYWLACDTGKLTNVADSITNFEQLLSDAAHVDDWFLPNLVNQLLNANITLGSDQVYSYYSLPVLGGDYSAENMRAANVYIHFEFTGLIFHQIKDLPNETKVKITITD